MEFILITELFYSGQQIMNNGFELLALYTLKDKVVKWFMWNQEEKIISIVPGLLHSRAIRIKCKTNSPDINHIYPAYPAPLYGPGTNAVLVSDNSPHYLTPFSASPP